jgi:hypothetical protein
MVARDKSLSLESLVTVGIVDSLACTRRFTQIKMNGEDRGLAWRFGVEWKYSSALWRGNHFEAWKFIQQLDVVVLIFARTVVCACN